MNTTTISHILQAVAQQELSPEDALHKIATEPTEQLLNGLTLDTQRGIRTGVQEVVFAQGKSDEHLCSAVKALFAKHGKVLATRVSIKQGQILNSQFPQGEFWQEAQLFSIGISIHDSNLFTPIEKIINKPDVLIITAGAADMPVALEAYGTARFFSLNTCLATDIGVAGLHRITPWLPIIHTAKVCIVIAGMEGALPSVIAGLCPCPVLAVPTSVGYGISAGGHTALHSMLASCASGISVFNIDNGFGAAVFALKMLNTFKIQ